MGNVQKVLEKLEGLNIKKEGRKIPEQKSPVELLKERVRALVEQTPIQGWQKRLCFRAGVPQNLEGVGGGYYRDPYGRVYYGSGFSGFTLTFKGEKAQGYLSIRYMGRNYEIGFSSEKDEETTIIGPFAKELFESLTQRFAAYEQQKKQDEQEAQQRAGEVLEDLLGAGPSEQDSTH